MEIDRDTPLSNHQSLLNAKDACPNIPLTDEMGRMTDIEMNPVTARFVRSARPRLSRISAGLTERTGLKGHPAAEDKYNSDTNTVSLPEN